MPPGQKPSHRQNYDIPEKRGRAPQLPSRPKGPEVPFRSFEKTAETAPGVQKLVECYFKANCNRQGAMRLYGYSEKTIHNRIQTDRIWARSDIQTEVARVQRAMRAKFEIDEEWVLQQYAKIAGMADLSELLEVDRDGNLTVDMTRLTPEMRTALHFEVAMEPAVNAEGRKTGEMVQKVKVKQYSKLDALNALSRHMGLFNDRVEIGAAEDLIETLQAGRKRIAHRIDDAEFVEVKDEDRMV